MILDEKKVNAILQKNGLTKSALCGEIGVSSRTIARIAKGEEIRESVIQRIADRLHVETSDLCENDPVWETLDRERRTKVSGGLYHETQIRLSYNSNHIEGTRLTEEQTRFIFETKTLGALPSDTAFDDIVETNNHFRCLDLVIEKAKDPLSEEFIIALHRTLKMGTNSAETYGAGVYKTFPNTVGGLETTEPANVKKEMAALLKWYRCEKKASFERIVEFHYRFECLHPFQDGNGRVGRLIAFKECLKNGMIPFYIDDRFKYEYYNGLRRWKEERGFLLETCRLGQDLYKRLLTYFSI